MCCSTLTRNIIQVPAPIWREAQVAPEAVVEVAAVAGAEAVQGAAEVVVDAVVTTPHTMTQLSLRKNKQ